MSFALLLCVQGFAQKTQEFFEAQARVSNGDAEIHVVPTIVQVKVLDGPDAQPVMETIELKPEQVVGLGGNIANIKAYASYEFTIRRHCSIILNPLYYVETVDKGGVKVMVYGVPGIFEKWHSAEKDDFEWLKNEHNWSKDLREVAAPVITR